MTSFAPLIDHALRTLAEAERGSFSRLDAAAQYDLDYARSLTPAQRMAALNDILLLAEAFNPSVAPASPAEGFAQQQPAIALAEGFGLPPPSREPVVHGPLLM